jgi:hypothetical protein
LASGTEGLREVRQGNNLAWVAAATAQVVAASHMKVVEVQRLPQEIVAAKGMMVEDERALVQRQKGPEEAVQLRRDPEVVRLRGSWMVVPRQKGPVTEERT